MEKSTPPMIWLDTSIISKIARYKLGKSLNESDKERISKLYILILEKVKEKKLLCPEADQIEELNLFIQGEDEYKKFVKECYNIIASLSVGSRLYHHKGIERVQMQLLMKAFCNREEKIHVSYKDIYNEPKIMDFRGGKIFLTTQLSGAMENYSKQLEAKGKFHKNYENLRQSKVNDGLTYEEALEIEYLDELQIIEYAKHLYFKLLNGEILSQSDFERMRIYFEKKRDWEVYGCVPKSFEGLKKFLRSDYYKSIPNVDISSKLFAKIWTSPKKIESGDTKDIKYLSIIIPYYDYVVTDKKMKNFISDLELDTKYDTRVFCLRNFEQLFNEIEIL